MQKVVNQLKGSSLQKALFVTLTYPDVVYEGQKIKRDLSAFIKRLLRAFPSAAGVWKLESQERGSPHYHLLVLGVEFIHHTWVSSAWYDIVGSGNPDHRRSGTQVRRVQSHKHAMRYVAKYLSKPTESYEDGDGLGEVGRRWGKFGDWRSHLGEFVSMALNARESAKLARILDHKRLAGARLIRAPWSRRRAITKARRRRPLKLSQYWLGSPDVVLANIFRIIGRDEHVLS
jgi:hypothetical protein